MEIGRRRIVRAAPDRKASQSAHSASFSPFPSAILASSVDLSVPSSVSSPRKKGCALFPSSIRAGIYKREPFFVNVRIEIIYPQEMRNSLTTLSGDGLAAILNRLVNRRYLPLFIFLSLWSPVILPTRARISDFAEKVARLAEKSATDGESIAISRLSRESRERSAQYPRNYIHRYVAQRNNVYASAHGGR